MLPILYIIIPCYNEQDVLPKTAPLFQNKLSQLIVSKKICEKSRILLVDDGSQDNTWKIISNLSQNCSLFCGICQSRNRGHQNAVLAGLMEAKNLCDITISIDCDGQDDMNVMDLMINAYLDGNEIVYGVRNNRDTDSWFKRFTAEKFYKIMSWMGAEVIYNHADYRLVSAKVLHELSNFREVNIFLRGMIPLVGFQSTCVYYERQKRLAGKSHYPLKKMTALALDGITSLSIKPIRIITTLGLVIAFFSFIGVLWSILMYIMNNTVSGWASMTSIICFIGGVQLVSLGILGEYIGKIYLETKSRPRYIISKRTDDPGEKQT
jgi:glycosyltransferase involved in cell wall biosynthesis